VLGSTPTQEPEQSEVLGQIASGLLIRMDDLVASGVLPVATAPAAQKPPRQQLQPSDGLLRSVAEITARRQGEMVQMLFGVLQAEPEGLQAKTAIARVADAMELTDFEKSTFPKSPGETRFPKLLRFSTINSVKAGWMRKKSGIWSVTAEGAQALKDFPDPEAFFKESGRLYKEWKAEQPDDGDGQGAGEGGGGTEKGLIAATTLEEAAESARSDILEYVGSINPYKFQDLVGKLLEAMGYHVVWIAPKGKDGGLDLLAQSDPLGVHGPRIKGQVKRRPDSKTNEDELRSFLSLVETTDVGVFISLGGLSFNDKEKARRTPRRLTLIDGDTLLDLWVEHFDKLDEEGRQLLPVKAVHFLDLDADAA